MGDLTSRATAVQHVAQFNVALPVAPLESEQLAGFTSMLDVVNARADRAEGFIWRLQDESGDATGFQSSRDERWIVNLSVWESIEALRAFAYDDEQHLAVLRRRREWFAKLDVSLVIWWIPSGHIPSLDEAEGRLRLLETHGPSAEAFTFRRSFPAPSPGAVPTGH